jgi:hypothetical protein
MCRQAGWKMCFPTNPGSNDQSHNPEIENGHFVPRKQRAQQALLLSVAQAHLMIGHALSFCKI